MRSECRCGAAFFAAVRPAAADADRHHCVVVGARRPHAPLFAQLAQLVQMTGHQSAAPPDLPIRHSKTIGLIFACSPLGAIGR